MIYVVTINNKKYEVEVERGSATIINESIIENVITAEDVNIKKSTAITSDPAKPAYSGTGEAVKSPMPGAILDIKVNEGSRVKKGDVVIILEAMKMENEVFSPTDGTVSKILISKGSNVESNQILMVIN